MLLDKLDLPEEIGHRQASSSFGAEGPLGGRTILRFAHAYDSGGGTERYLDDLDGTLLRRSAMTVIRLHLTHNAVRSGPEEKQIGMGRLVRIALPVIAGDTSAPATFQHLSGRRLKQQVRDWLLYNPLVWRAAGARYVFRLRLRSRPGEAIDAGIAAAEILRNQPIDLAMLHFFGGSDADAVMTEARKARVPVALLNHYSNDRFMHLAIRKHAMDASAVAGVNGLDLTGYLRGRLVNLSDGIDTEFFSRTYARPLPDPPDYPVILLPARVVREKGQMDLVRAVSSLRTSGLDCGIAFAGRMDASDFVDELKQAIAQSGMTARVRFLGNLGVEELRDWYGASSVVAFPTYHHEGLGRVIVEAQAMGVPVVAYATGGVAEAITPAKTGYLLRTGDISGLAGRLGELLASPSLRATMGRFGREATEKQFSLAALADRHERFYMRVIAASRAGT